LLYRGSLNHLSVFGSFQILGNMQAKSVHLSSLASIIARKATTAAQQGAAPDRLQLRSSFLLSALPAAGELVVLRLRAVCSGYLLHPYDDIW
jgi:hypothetical protein